VFVDSRPAIHATPNDAQNQRAIDAYLKLALDDLRRLLACADIAAAMSVEALLGTDAPFAADLQGLRPHPGQADSAANLRALLAGSGLMASHRHSRHAVQDAYCLRCAPQVHGAVRDVLGYARQVIDTELGAVVDNPVIVADGEVMTTGNFHGEPLAFAADMLGIAVSELASISERRVDRMLDPAFSRGLPPFLAPDAGTNSGYMLAQYTAASLVSENKVLAHPSSVDTIPTSGKQEDHVSMGWTGVRKLREIVQNVRTCLSVEILCAAQGVGMRADIAQPSGPIAAVHSLIRDNVPRMDVDREVSEQIAIIDQLLPDICETASAQVGGFRQGAVALLVTEMVVDVFQPVQINADEQDAAARPGNELQVLFGQEAEAAMIVKASEVVEQRQSAQTGLHAMALHGVAQGAGKRSVVDVVFADIILSPGSQGLGG